MQYLINGAKYSFGAPTGLAVALASIGNSVNPTATVETGGAVPNDGSIVLLRSNWTDLNTQAAYTSGKSGQTFKLDGLDTSDTSLFVPSESAPSAYQLLSNFTSLSQIISIEKSGGVQNSETYGYIDNSSPRQQSLPTDKTPVVLTFTMHYDPELPWYDALIELDRSKAIVAMRERLPTGDVLLHSGYLAFDKHPTRQRNGIMAVTATLSINSDSLRYPKSYFQGS